VVGDTEPVAVAEDAPQPTAPTAPSTTAAHVPITVVPRRLLRNICIIASPSDIDMSAHALYATGPPPPLGKNHEGHGLPLGVTGTADRADERSVEITEHSMHPWPMGE